MATLIPLRAVAIAILAGRTVLAQTRPVAPDSGFAAQWSRLCGPEVPKDLGLIDGVVTDAVTRKPIEASIEVTWYEVYVDKQEGVKQRRWKLETKSSPRGTFVLCGVPADKWLRVGAGVSGKTSGLVDLPPTDARVQRRDLVIGGGASDGRGFVFGTLTETNGTPFANARIVLDDSIETRSDLEGHFSLREVETGTRQVEILSIGMVPVVTTVDVFPKDSTPLAMAIRRITALDVVRVSASSRARTIIDDFEARKKSGLGYTREAGEIISHADLSSVFREIPSVQIDRSEGSMTVVMPDGKGGACPADFWLDGALNTQAAFSTIRMNEIVALEVYVRPETVPVQFTRAASSRKCGAIVMWSTWIFAR
jgi:hypothetical protein